MRGRIHIGTSGWSYNHWSGVFYPEDLGSKNRLSFYARIFSTVEVNYTFYRLPEETTFSRWKDTVPEGFVFAVKASSYITHRKRLAEPGQSHDRFIDRSAILGDRLGPVLYQLPPRMRADASRLSAMIETADELWRKKFGRRVRMAFEFRHDSWFSPEVLSILSKHGCALVIADWPTGCTPCASTADFVYVRMHGSQERYGSRYSHGELERWADQLTEWAAEGLDVYVYFNNDAHGYAVENARDLGGLVGANGSATP